MGMAPMAFVLFARFLRHDPARPRWIARDRFVLSNGHACALLYSVSPGKKKKKFYLFFYFLFFKYFF